MKKTHFSVSTIEAQTPCHKKRMEECIRDTVGLCDYEIWPETPFHAVMSRHEGKGYLAGTLKHRFQSAGAGCKERINLRPNTDAAFYLLVSKTGCCSFEQRNEEFGLKENDILILNYQEACTYTSKNQNSHLLGFGANEQIVQNWLPPRAYQKGQIIDRSSPWAQALRDLMSSIETPLMDEIDDENCNLANTICCYLSLCLDDPSETISSYRETLLQRLRKVLFDRFKDPSLSVEDVASELGISQRVLHSTFQSAGTTFRGEITSLRLNYAQGLRTEPTTKLKTLQEIATLSGFSHRNNFLGAFKKYYGVTPITFRKTLLD